MGKVDLSRVYLGTTPQPWDNITPQTSTSGPSQNNRLTRSTTETQLPYAN